MDMSPRLVAMAPASYGAFAGALLARNFADRKINAFSPSTRVLLGRLADLNGNPIAIPELWPLGFGGGADSEDYGTLYITAGIGGGPTNDPVESHWLFASIQAAGSFAGIQNGASLIAGPIAPGTWTTINGNALSRTTGSWQIAGITLPTVGNGVGHRQRQSGSGEFRKQ
jgi:hypothetical protein